MNIGPYIFQSGKNDFPLFFFTYRNCCRKLLKYAEKDIEKQIVTFSKAEFVSLNISGRTQKFMRSVVAKYHSKDPLIVQKIERIAFLLELSPKEQLRAIANGALKAEKDFSKFQIPFKANQWKSVLTGWKEALCMDRDKVLADRGIKQISQGIPLTDADKRFLSIERQKPVNLDHLDPAAYVFMKLREPKIWPSCVVPLINIDLYFGGKIAMLLKWGYRPVLRPRRGDIVVYIVGNPDLNGFHIKHYGIYLGGKKVQSKYGRYSFSGIYKHDIFDIPLGSGHQAIFIRKETKFNK